MTRGCAQSCTNSCDLDGYGLDIAHCNDCCQTDLCNSNYSVQYYVKLMEGRHTSWIQPVSGEREFNQENGIRFPY